MHYYDFELCSALRAAGIDLTLLTCDETQVANIPQSLPVEYPFQGIYGSASKVRRGLRYMRALLSIGLAMNRNRIPLIHLHYHHFPPLDDLFLRWLYLIGKRAVLTVHDVIPFDANSRQMGWLGNIYRRADRIIVHAQDNYEAIVRAFDIAPERIQVIPMGPYLHFADEHAMPAALARKTLGLDPDAPVILFFGQIKRVKGLDHLIRAFAQVVQECPKAHLIIAGPEWKEPFEGYADLIRELGIVEQVNTRIEYVPDDEVGVYYSAADLVALPYTEAYQSAVLYMAHSFRRPVVATTVGGLPEVVTDGENGLLVPPGDTNALANALLILCQDLDRDTEYGQAWALAGRNQVRLARDCAQDRPGIRPGTRRTASLFSKECSRRFYRIVSGSPGMIINKLFRSLRLFFRRNRYRSIVALTQVESRSGFVLDLGGGPASFFSAMFPRPEQMILIDVDYDIVRQAQKKTSAHLLVADGQKLPLADRSIDTDHLQLCPGTRGSTRNHGIRDTPCWPKLFCAGA